MTYYSISINTTFIDKILTGKLQDGDVMKMKCNCDFFCKETTCVYLFHTIV